MAGGVDEPLFRMMGREVRDTHALYISSCTSIPLPSNMVICVLKNFLGDKFEQFGIYFLQIDG